LSELKDFGELEPQFRFEGDAMPIGDVTSGDVSDAGTDATDINTDTDTDTIKTEHEFASQPPSTEDDTEFHQQNDSHDESNDNTSLESSALAEDGDSDRSNA